MEEFISFLTNLYATRFELILIGGGSVMVVLISVLIFFLTRKKVDNKPEIAEEVSSMETFLTDSFHKEQMKEIEPQESMSYELIEEEAADEVELEEFGEAPKDEATEVVIRMESTVPKDKIEEEPEETTEAGLFSRLRAGLSRTQVGLLGKLDEMLSLRKEIDDGY